MSERGTSERGTTEATRSDSAAGRGSVYGAERA